MSSYLLWFLSASSSQGVEKARKVVFVHIGLRSCEAEGFVLTKIGGVPAFAQDAEPLCFKHLRCYRLVNSIWAFTSM
jgi:hypothetical protein